MGSKRGLEKIDKLRDKLYAGMKENGLEGQAADDIYAKIQAFANFGFAESHSLSFGLLVYASSWIKLHYPGAFLAGLLRAQPMGFYSPATLAADARRHGVEVRRPDLLRSGAEATLEPVDGSSVPERAKRDEGPDPRESPASESPVPESPVSESPVSESPVPESSAPERSKRDEGPERSHPSGPTGLDTCAHREQPPVGDFDPSAPDEYKAHRRDGGFAVRLGLAGVHGIGDKVAERIVAERDRGGAYRDMRDLVRRAGVTAAQLESLATAGAFECLGLSRREAIWLAGSAAEDRAEYLPDSLTSVQPPLFTDPTSYETLAADLWATGISTTDHPLTHYRAALDARGVLTSGDMRTHESGRRVEVAGLVTHRQRPATASGITFLNLEDEHGLVNVICSVGVWNRYRRIARESPALIVRGVLERSVEGVTNLLADRFEDLRVGVAHASRDFR
jgi:error-prone DNA polymerase